MRIYFVILLCLKATLNYAQQNLVPNGSFENVNNLPLNWISSKSEFAQCFNDWYMPSNGTPDLFNLNLPISYKTSCFSTSDNAVGQQPPSDGDNMVGIYAYDDGLPSYREYLQIKLKSKLQIGKTYIVSMNVSLADKSSYAIKNIGMNLSTSAYTQYSGVTILNLPYNVESQEVIDNKALWVNIRDTIVASKAYEYLTIGNFLPDHLTSIFQLDDASQPAYYFIDDVRIYEPLCAEKLIITAEDSSVCIGKLTNAFINDLDWDFIKWNNNGSKEITNQISHGYTRVKVRKGECTYRAEIRLGVFRCKDKTYPTANKYVELLKKPIIPNVITPNGDGFNDKFIIEELWDSHKISIYNRWGHLVYESNDYQNEWDAEGLKDGSYYYQLLHTKYEERKGSNVTGWVQVLR